VWKTSLIVAASGIAITGWFVAVMAAVVMAMLALSPELICPVVMLGPEQ